MLKTYDICIFENIGSLRKGQKLEFKVPCGSPKDFLRTSKDFSRNCTLAPQLNQMCKLSIFAYTAVQQTIGNSSFGDFQGLCGSPRDFFRTLTYIMFLRLTLSTNVPSLVKVIGAVLKKPKFAEKNNNNNKKKNRESETIQEQDTFVLRRSQRYN